jgi:hypothetical protein
MPAAQAENHVVTQSGHLVPIWGAHDTARLETGNSAIVSQFPGPVAKAHDVM